MIYGICGICKKRRFFVRKRKIKLPTGDIATSQKLMCGKCDRIVKKAVNIKTNGT